MDASVVVGDNVVARVALINNGLENLDTLASDLRPPQTPDQLLTLTAEHGTANYLDPA
jgi:hypothetical protein